MATESTRDRIIRSAATLLADGGRDAVTTRSVSAAADVQSPAIYRHFGDMSGLLDAVAEHGFARYLAEKGALPPSGDPVEDLRRGIHGSHDSIEAGRRRGDREGAFRRRRGTGRAATTTAATTTTAGGEQRRDQQAESQVLRRVHAGVSRDQGAGRVWMA